MKEVWIILLCDHVYQINCSSRQNLYTEDTCSVTVQEHIRAVGGQGAENISTSRRSRYLLIWISSKSDKEKVTKEEKDKL